MAQLRDGDQKGLGRTGWFELIELLLQAADAILRVFGRRDSDRAAREKPDVTPPGDAPGGVQRK